MYPAYFVHGIDGSRYEEPKPPAPGYDLVVFLGELYLGIDQLLRLIPLLCVCPSNALGPRPVFRRFHWYEWLCKTPLAIAWKFVTMPLLSPQDHARRLYKTVNVKGKRRQEAQPPPPKATVRVKWYPDLDTPLKPWPAGLGELWTDLPIEPDGSLDLRPLRRMWGMENIYVIDASRGRRLRTGRKPDDQLSKLAWNVLLDGHRVLGVIERATPSTQVAREGRAFLKRLTTDPTLWLSLMKALPATVLWTALVLLAIPILMIWRIGELASSLVAIAAHTAWTRLAMHVSPTVHSVRRRLAVTSNDSTQSMLALCSKVRRAGYRFVDVVASIFSVLGSMFSKYVSPLLAWLLFAVGACVVVLVDGLYQVVAPVSNQSTGDEAYLNHNSPAEDETYPETEVSDNYSYGTSGEHEDLEGWDAERTGDYSYGDHEEEHDEDVGYESGR